MPQDQALRDAVEPQDLRAVGARDSGGSTECAPCAVIYFQIVSALALAKRERTALAIISRLRMIHTGTSQIRQCSGKRVDGRRSVCGSSRDRAEKPHNDCEELRHAQHPKLRDPARCVANTRGLPTAALGLAFRLKPALRPVESLGPDRGVSWAIAAQFSCKRFELKQWLPAQPD